jgi:hypothetical protein
MGRNIKQYHVVPIGAIPKRIIVRDILATTLAWGLWLYICWDVIVMLETGLLMELDFNPESNMEWELFFRQLGISYTFSGIIIVFLIGWGIANSVLIARTLRMPFVPSVPLSAELQGEAYDCKPDDIRAWRDRRKLTVLIDDTGKILKVE